ncbi:MAG: response regulator [Acidobacteria bacterium]|nr:MAG: response regulator [Acidobacteriota bacterium]
MGRGVGGRHARRRDAARGRARTGRPSRGDVQAPATRRTAGGVCRVAEAAHAPRRRSPQMSNPGRMPCKLLLVDDSVTIRRVVELTFAGEDVNVVAVGDGREAMARILDERPDIVLADVGPGEPDGYEVAAFVKRHPALSHVPVVLLTGAFQPVDRVRAAECGCDGVLAKPFDLQSMVGVVRGLLQHKGFQGPPATPELAPPAEAAGGNGDAGALIDWWARLLEQHGPPQPSDPLPITPVSAMEDTGPSPAPAAPLTLDDYFDLVDDFLARPADSAGRPSPIPPFRHL